MSRLQRRKPRFKREPTGRIEVTERDVEIIRQVYKHRFLRSTHIVALINASRQTTLRRLQLLYHHGYLDRQREQIEFYTRAGSKPITYGLGGKGADLLTRHLAIPRGKVDWTAKNRSVSQIFLDHTLLVSDLMVALEVACRHSGSVRLIDSDEIVAAAPEATRQQANPLAWHVQLRHRDQNHSLTVVPDRIFGLHFTDAPEGKNKAYFFLEADRATMPVIRKGLQQTSFYRKMLAYLETWRQQLHTQLYGIKNFRVLSVTTSQARIRNLIEAGTELTGGRGSNLFLFADKAAIDPETVLSLQWRSGKDGEAVRLLD
jgi:hypothetical protein